jgi:hypothetical protein
MTTDRYPKYRIDFTITRRMPGEDDFTEIGFGSSGGGSGSLDHEVHLLASVVQNRQWETSPGMPDPSDDQPF